MNRTQQNNVAAEAEDLRLAITAWRARVRMLDSIAPYSVEADEAREHLRELEFRLAALAAYEREAA